MQIAKQPAPFKSRSTSCNASEGPPYLRTENLLLKMLLLTGRFYRTASLTYLVIWINYNILAYAALMFLLVRTLSMRSVIQQTCFYSSTFFPRRSFTSKSMRYSTLFWLLCRMYQYTLEGQMQSLRMAAYFYIVISTNYSYCALDGSSANWTLF